MTEKEMNKILDHVKDSSVGDAIIEYVNKMISELDSVNGVSSVEEVIGRQEAINKLKRLKNRVSKDKEKREEGSQYK